MVAWAGTRTKYCANIPSSSVHGKAFARQTVHQWLSATTLVPGRGTPMRAPALEMQPRGAVPWGAYVSDPCDGRTQGTTGMFDSLPYRNDASTVFRRLIRSLPTRRGVMGVATCDKGLPAMMMALAAMHDLPCVLVPGGVTLLADEGEDAARIQS